MVPEEGLEPSQGYPYRILSPNKLSLGIIRGERRGDSSMFCRTGVCALVLLRVASLGTVTGTVLDYPSCNESTNPKLSGRVDLNTPIRNADQVESVCNPKWLRRFCCFWRIDARPEKSRVSPFESRKNRNRFGLEVITHPGLEKRESK